MLTLPRNPEHIRPLHDEDFFRLEATHPRLPHSHVDCITCHGIGTFLWYSGDEPELWECDCREQYKLHLFLLNSGIPLIYQRLRWEDARGVEPAALKVATDYYSHLARRIRSGIGLVLHGEMGAGKSMLVYLLAKAAVQIGFSVQALTFQDFLDAYTKGWSNTDEGRAAQAWFEQRIIHADLLVIDDLAREYSGRSKVAEAALDHVLRTRVAASRPTLLTSNRDLAELASIYSANALSLLSECSIVHQFTGEDFRPRAARRRLDEDDANLDRPVILS